MRWIAFSVIVLAACADKEPPPPGFDTPRAAVDALKAAYLARDGDAYLDCIAPTGDHRQQLADGYLRIPAMFDDLEQPPKNLGELFAFLDEHGVAHRVFATMPGGLEAFKTVDPFFVYATGYPGPWTLEKLESEEGDEAVVHVHMKSGGHDIRTRMPLQKIAGRWYVQAPFD